VSHNKEIDEYILENGPLCKERAKCKKPTVLVVA